MSQKASKWDWLTQAKRSGCEIEELVIVQLDQAKCVQPGVIADEEILERVVSHNAAQS